MKSKKILLLGFVFAMSCSTLLWSQNQEHTSTKFKLEHHQNDGKRYRASQSISLNNGFEVKKGESFSAHLLDYTEVSNNLKNHLMVYSDKRSHSITVELKMQPFARGFGTVALYNDQGKLVMTKKMRKTPVVFSMDNRQQGMYLLKYEEGEQTLIKKCFYH